MSGEKLCQLETGEDGPSRGDCGAGVHLPVLEDSGGRRCWCIICLCAASPLSHPCLSCLLSSPPLLPTQAPALKSSSLFFPCGQPLGRVWFLVPDFRLTDPFAMCVKPLGPCVTLPGCWVAGVQVASVSHQVSKDQLASILHGRSLGARWQAPLCSGCAPPRMGDPCL